MNVPALAADAADFRRFLTYFGLSYDMTRWDNPLSAWLSQRLSAQSGRSIVVLVEPDSTGPLAVCTETAGGARFDFSVPAPAWIRRFLETTESMRESGDWCEPMTRADALMILDSQEEAEEEERERLAPGDRAAQIRRWAAGPDC